jgi:hypothetical protein
LYLGILSIARDAADDAIAGKVEVIPAKIAREQARIVSKPLKSASSMFGDRYSKSLPKALNTVKTVKSATVRALHSNAAISSNSDPIIVPVTSESANLKNQTIIDPAHSVKILESLGYVWVNEITLPHSDPSLISIRLNVLGWIYANSKNEIWSIKRQALILLGVISIRTRDLSSSDILKFVSHICDSYNGNSMHNQVREASISSLRKFLEQGEGSSIELLKAEHAPAIRLLMTRAQSDSAPGVLDELHRMKTIWRTVVVSASDFT